MNTEYLVDLLHEEEISEARMDKILRQYVRETYGYYKVMEPKDALTRLLSDANYRDRCKKGGAGELGIWIKPGDICYIDYGLSYLNEMGFQHFGLVVKIVHCKAFVIPMTSNEKTYRNALKKDYKGHLMPIGKIPGMYKDSVLFLNDYRSINTARVIGVQAHISTKSELFQTIKSRLQEIVL